MKQLPVLTQLVMPKYAIEKFENSAIPNPPAGVPERKVYWVATKHVHNAAMITDIAKWLDTNYPLKGWKVRKNSFQSNQPSAPNDATAVEYEP